MMQRKCSQRRRQRSSSDDDDLVVSPSTSKQFVSELAQNLIQDRCEADARTRRTRVNPICMAIDRREVNLHRSFCPIDDSSFVDRLLLSNNRELVQKVKRDVPHGKIVHDGERMIMYGNDVEFYDVTQDTWQRNICHLADTFVAGEKIVHVLVSDGSFDPGDGSDPPRWLILLSSYGRVLMCNSVDGTIERRFQLPADGIKYRSISWNCPFEEFYVKGRRTEKDGEFVVAFFQLHPLMFRGMFYLSHEVFGGNVAHVSIWNSCMMLTVQNPNRIEVYSTKNIMNEFCLNPFREGEGEGGHQLPFNVEITRKPPVLFVIPGTFANIEFGCSNYVLCSPMARHQKFLLRELNDVTKTPHLNEFTLSCDEVGDFGRLQPEMTHMFWAYDESSTLWRFETPWLCCYSVYRRPGEERGEVNLLWKTPLLAAAGKKNECSTSKRGRRLSQNSEITNDTVARVTWCSYDGMHLFHLLLLYSYELAMEVQYPVYAILDNVTGLVLRLVDLSPAFSEEKIDLFPSMARFTAHVHENVFLMHLKTISGSCTYFRAGVLVDTKSREWETDRTKEKPLAYKSMTLNRKQRRRERRAANSNC